MKQSDLIKLLKNKPYKIGKLLGYNDLTELHNNWIKQFLYGKNDYTLKAHRGSYKTTALIVALTLLIVLKPNETILFVRKTETDVIEIIKAVSKCLKNPYIQEIVKILYNVELQLLTDTTSEITTNLKTDVRGTAQLTALGSTSSLTGKHYERIYTDDLVTIKDRISEAERNRIKIVYMELQNLKNRGGRIVNTGTTWHKEDCFSIMPEAEIFTCYDTGLMNEKEIQNVRNVMTPSLFAANYELKHIADENALFSQAKYTSDIEKIYNGIAHVDARYEGEDFTAFTIMKMHDDGNIYAFGKLFNSHVDQCIDVMKHWHQELRAGSIYCEKNADKGYLAEKLNNNGFIAHSYHEKMNKHIKISTHLYTHWKNIYWISGTDPDYINQILDYNENAQHDDAPDGAASLIAQAYTKQITIIEGLKL